MIARGARRVAIGLAAAAGALVCGCATPAAPAPDANARQMQVSPHGARVSGAAPHTPDLHIR